MFYPESHAACKLGLTLGTQFAHPTVLVRRQIFQNFRYSAEAKAYEDVELWCRMAAAGVKMGNVQFAGLLYRVHQNQGSSVSRQRQAQGTLDTISRYCRNFANHDSHFKAAGTHAVQHQAAFVVETVVNNYWYYKQMGLDKQVKQFLYCLLPNCAFPRKIACRLAFDKIHLMCPSSDYFRLLSRCFLSDQQYQLLAAIIKQA